MPRKPASVPLSDEERRAAKIRAWQERRRRQGKPTDGSPGTTTLLNPPVVAGPAGGYTLVNVPAAAAEIEVTHHVP